MGNFPGSVRTARDRLRDLPRAYVAVGVAYALVRIYIVAGTTVAGSFPDTPTYRRVVTGPAYPLVSLTGRAMRPWVPPLLFAILPSDGTRSAAQVLISIGAWLVLAATVALALRDRRVRMVAFVVILAMSGTTAVTSWDRIIGSESTAISFAVLAIAAWICFARRATPLNAAATLAATILWSFTKSGVFPVVALAALIVVVSMVEQRDRILRSALAGALVLVALWGLVANSNSDTEYRAYNGQGLSQFSGNFATYLRLQILNDPADTRWFEQHGMPDTSGLTPFKRTTVLDNSWSAGEQQFLSEYLARPDLTHWVDTKGQRAYEEFLVTHAGEIAGRFSREVPYVLVPPKSQLIYTNEPRAVMPAFLSNVFFATTNGPALPRALLGDIGALVLACLVLLVLPRRRPHDVRLLFVAGAVFLLAFVALALGWVLSPIELVRHGLPATIVLRLALWIVVFALADAVVPGNRSSARRDPRGRARHDAVSRGGAAQVDQ